MQAALPRLRGPVDEGEPDEHAHARVAGRERERLLGVPGLRVERDAGGVRDRLVAVLRDPDRRSLSPERRVERLAEALEVAEGDARPAHRPGRGDARAAAGTDAAPTRRSGARAAAPRRVARTARASGCPAPCPGSGGHAHAATSRRSRRAPPGSPPSRRRTPSVRCPRRAPATPTRRRRRTAARGTARGSARSRRCTGGRPGSRRGDPSSGRRGRRRSPRGPARLVGGWFGVCPPFAHSGVPQMLRSSSIPRCCELRTRSSRSSKWYAGSNESRAFAGLLVAASFQATIVRMTEAFASRAASSAVARSGAQRNDASS